VETEDICAIRRWLKGIRRCPSRSDGMQFYQAAGEAKGSLQRLLKVVAYTLSTYSPCHSERVNKPLFSVPGETLEAVYPQKGVRYIGESIQVRLHFLEST